MMIKRNGMLLIQIADDVYAKQNGKVIFHTHVNHNLTKEELFDLADNIKLIRESGD